MAGEWWQPWSIVALRQPQADPAVTAKEQSLVASAEDRDDANAEKQVETGFDLHPQTFSNCPTDTEDCYEMADPTFWANKRRVLEELCGTWKDSFGTLYTIALEEGGISCETIQTRIDGSTRTFSSMIWISEDGDIFWGNQVPSFVLDEVSVEDGCVRWWPRRRSSRARDFFWTRVVDKAGECADQPVVAEDCSTGVASSEEDDKSVTTEHTTSTDSALANKAARWADMESDSDDYEFCQLHRRDSLCLTTASAQITRRKSNLSMSEDGSADSTSASSSAGSPSWSSSWETADGGDVLRSGSDGN